MGQILGPLVATPLLRHGYHQALILAAVVVLASAVAAALLRIGFPHHMPALGHPVVRAEPAPDRQPTGLDTAEARAD